MQRVPVHSYVFSIDAQTNGKVSYAPGTRGFLYLPKVLVCDIIIARSIHFLHPGYEQQQSFRSIKSTPAAATILLKIHGDPG